MTRFEPRQPAPPIAGDRREGRHAWARPGLRDVLLALGVTAVTIPVVMIALRLVEHEGVVLTDAGAVALVVVTSLQALTLCLRRTAPAWCFCAVSAWQIAVIAIAPDLSVRGIALLVAAYGIGTRLPLRRTLVLAGAAIGVESLAALGAARLHGADAILPLVNHLGSAAIGYLGFALLGVYVTTRRDNLRLLQEQAEQTVREHRERVQTAVATERTRIAGDLHDVAAHHLSGMVVQAAAVERLVDRDPAAAKVGAAALRLQGKETLDGLRRVVGLLREEAEPEDTSTPGLAALSDLLDAARALGGHIVFHREGEIPELEPVADAAFYRAAQQALTNARQHAPGAAVKVSLRRRDRELVLEVVNARVPAEHSAGSGEEDLRSGGTGLVVMRERAALVGAELETGPTADGGWRVLLRLPLDGPGPRGRDPGAGAGASAVADAATGSAVRDSGKVRDGGDREEPR